MKLGVFTVLFSQQSLERTLDYVAEAGCQAVELGVGGYPGDAHCNAKRLLASAAERRKLLAALKERGLTISALSCHGNPLHPNKAIARQHDAAFRDACRLADKLGVKVVITFSGCPGDSERSKYPNWVTCPWPPDFLEILDWQWNKKVIPYWKDAAAFAKKHGVRVALEMHPGFVVYSAETLLRLRKAVGANIGANFDPSHLFWQGADPIAAVRALKGAIFHVHAKDTYVNPYNTSVNGVLDTKSYLDTFNRSWVFRTVGYGHSLRWWKEFVSTLREVGYDGVLSIEHEDSLMSVNEGFKKAVALLQEALMFEGQAAAWWV